MTPQELKNSILQLAIQGKLVEQRPEEGTAEELYQQIQTEKQQLIKAGTIKKEKPLLEITEDEKPFDIPENWIWVRVGNIGSWNAGATPSRTSPQYYNGNIPWLKTGDLNDGYITEVPEFISEMALEKTSVKLNPIGSVLMAMYGATIGKLGILSIEATTNQACCACFPLKNLFNKYLFYYLMANRKVFIKMGAGGAQPNISKEKIVSALMPLPPLAEQKRIVAKIEELMPYIDRYEKAWSKLEDFNKRFPTDMQKSILQMAIQGKLVEQRPDEGTGEELYQQIQDEKQRLIKAGTIKKEKLLSEITEDEKPFDIPESWKWVRLANICSVLNGDRGKNYPSKDTLSNHGIPFISALNLDGRTVVTDERLLCLSEEQYQKLGNGKLNLGDVVCCIRGSLGKHGRYPFEKGAIASSLVIMRLFQQQEIAVNYLMYYLDSPLFFAEIRRYDNGTAQPNLAANSLELFCFPLPPLAEQKRIIAKLEGILPLCGKLKK